jgi:predicted nicotinamide N-methyase
MDLKMATDEINGNGGTSMDGLIVATDFLPEVLANLKTCIDLNFPTTTGTGIEIAKLDWSTFPQYMLQRHDSDKLDGTVNSEEEETGRYMNEPFDLVLASDCVYDETHAKMLHEVVTWTLRLPNPEIKDDIGGTFVCPPNPV